ncbi:hypothetical protein KP509_39G016200 [Ceratopteris richardii]|uniref:SnoaL-like domain-containing protein n=1 Tax=Ceratopteris richardii TaxID=49495 RepID=A0A8T2PZ34_CERRI|nr:hypothetical protein KP509_39G016200 [Ceratopteris richardii]
MTLLLSLPVYLSHGSSSPRASSSGPASIPRLTKSLHFCGAAGKVAKCNSSRCYSNSHYLLFASSPRTSSSSTPITPDAAQDDPSRPGFSVVEEFYACVNRRDFQSARELFAEDCIYDDLVFPKPFMGREAIVDFFSKFMTAIGPDLQFVVEDISRKDPYCVGVTWHLELNGKRFPFSKGCSFYRLRTVNGRQEIIYARDSVEPALKAGDSVLVVIRAVAAVLRTFPQLADRF